MVKFELVRIWKNRVFPAFVFIFFSVNILGLRQKFEVYGEDAEMEKSIAGLELQEAAGQLNF